MEGDLGGGLGGGLEGELQRGLQRGLQTRLGRGLAVVLSSGQLRSRAGLVQIWICLEIKFNSLELDSEVGLVLSLLSAVTWRGEKPNSEAKKAMRSS